ncbi:MAG: hypothetical protein ABR562_00710 [Thermoplasmatota archaeon]|nr:hypothetical protein [Halobacteriales archaeon]
MAVANPFLVVEFPGEDLVFSEYTRKHPGSRVELLLEPVEEKGGVSYICVFLAKGLPDAAVARLEKDLKRRFAAPKTLRRDVLNQTWMGRIRIPRAKLKSASKGAQTMTEFRNRYGILWFHIEDGVLHMRARVADPDEAERLARQVRETMQSQGLDAQVEVQEVASQDFGVWRDIIELSLGLA